MVAVLRLGWRRCRALAQLVCVYGDVANQLCRFLLSQTWRPCIVVKSSADNLWRDYVLASNQEASSIRAHGV